MSSYYPLEIPRCEHIKDNGVRCGAPALKGKPLCYHHNDVHARRLRLGHKGYRFRPLETAESVTMQVAEIAQAAHDGTISLQLARVLLYATQIGAQQMRRLGPSCRDVETEVTEAMKAGDRVMGALGDQEAALQTTPLKPEEGLNGAPAHAARGRAASITEEIAEEEQNQSQRPRTGVSAPYKQTTPHEQTTAHEQARAASAIRTADSPKPPESAGPRFYDPEGCLAHLTRSS